MRCGGKSPAFLLTATLVDSTTIGQHTMNYLLSMHAQSGINEPPQFNAFKQYCHYFPTLIPTAPSHPLQNSPSRFLNRELSWLAFNHRVLDEAQNDLLPLLERLRFLTIAAHNHEEFLMVRVANLRHKIRHGLAELSPDGLTPSRQLRQVYVAARAYVKRLNVTWKRLRRALTQQGICIVQPEKLTPTECDALAEIFKRDYRSALVAIQVDTTKTFPVILTQTTALLLSANQRYQPRKHFIITLPTELPRLIRLPGAEHRYVLLEDVVVLNISQLLGSSYKLRTHETFRVLRHVDADTYENSTKPELATASQSEKQSLRESDIVSLAIQSTMLVSEREYLVQNLNVAPEAMVTHDFLALNDLRQLIHNNPALVFRSHFSHYPQTIKDFKGDCFAAIRQEDIIIYHPYERFDAVVDFIKQAAFAPDVIAIQQTIYRTNAKSPIILALIAAARNHKAVTVVIELKARFDEKANLLWAHKMKAAGIRVCFSARDLKAHAKVALVTCHNGKRITRYAHFGTGNYNPDTAKVYTDISFFTRNNNLCRGVAQLFDHMTDAKPFKLIPNLSMAPFNMRQTLKELILIEICNAKQGLPAHIWFKCNALGDPEIIDLLYQASQAGVTICLMVRGICTLRPGIVGLSENIQVFSIVGRFLEHARIYCFGNGRRLPSTKAKVYIASGDLMPHNLDCRIETLVKITNPRAHHKIISQIMTPYYADTMQSWAMQSDGSYLRKQGGEAAFSAHQYFLNAWEQKHVPIVNEADVVLADDIISCA